jgi:hypothetical protein
MAGFLEQLAFRGLQRAFALLAAEYERRFGRRPGP